MRSPLRGFPQKSRSGDRPGDGDFHSLSARWPIGRLFGQLCRSWLRWFSTGGGLSCRAFGCGFRPVPVSFVLVRRLRKMAIRQASGAETQVLWVCVRCVLDPDLCRSVN